jgi:hypothetical protein
MQTLKLEFETPLSEVKEFVGRRRKNHAVLFKKVWVKDVEMLKGPLPKIK